MSDLTYDEFPDANDYPQYSQQYLRDQEQAQKQAGDKSDPEKKQRIKTWMAFCLISVALLVDGLQFLLTGVIIGAILSPIISIGATFLFWTWFKILDVSYVASPKKLATMSIQAVVELIPVADALPILTVGIILIILITKSEDRGGVLGKAAGIATSAVKKQVKVEAINKSIRDQMNNNGNKPEAKNKNNQNKRAPSDNDQQKNGTSNQAAAIGKIVGDYQKRISGWQSEVQQLEQQLAGEKQHLITSTRFHNDFNEMSGSDLRLQKTQQQVDRMTSNKISYLTNRISQLKSSISSAKNKIEELKK